MSAYVFYHTPDMLLVRFEYDHHKERKLKQIPGSKKSRKQTADGLVGYFVPTAFHHILVKKLSDCIFTEPAKEQIARLNKLRELNNAVKPSKDFEIEGLKKTLMPHQLAAVEFHDLNLGESINADDTRLGKTISTLAWLQKYNGVRPVLIVCPSIVKYNWASEIDAWLPNQKVEILETRTPHELNRKDFYIVNYDILGAWLTELIRLPLQCLVVDETHYATTNRKGKRFEMLKELRFRLTKNGRFKEKAIPYFFGITATPVLNRTIELWPLLHLTKPLEFSSFHTFGKEFTNVGKNMWQQSSFRRFDYSESANVDELRHRVAPFVLSRTTDQIEEIRTQKKRNIYWVDVAQTHRDAYDEFKRSSKHSYLEMASELRVALAKAKIPYVVDWVKWWFRNYPKKSLVICAFHREILDKVFDKFSDTCVRLSGTESAKQKDDNKKAFLRGEKKIALCSQKSVIGIDLSVSSNMLMVEPWWGPQILKQVEARLGGVNQKSDEYVIDYVLARNTIDEEFVDMIQDKQDVIDTLAGTSKSFTFRS